MNLQLHQILYGDFKVIKCYSCSIKLNHKFSDCLSAECFCQCVKELYNFPTNNNEVDVSITNPKFMRIGNAETKALPDMTFEVNAFHRVRKEEWLPKTKDGRFTSTRKK